MFQKQSFIYHLQNRCSWVIHKIHSKKPALESLFNKVAVLRTLLKKTPIQVLPVKFANFLRTIILKNICECLLLNFI